MLGESKREELDRLVSALSAGGGRAAGGDGGDTMTRETWNDIKVTSHASHMTPTGMSHDIGLGTRGLYGGWRVSVLWRTDD